MEVFDILFENDPSGKMSKEKYLKEHYPQLHYNIIEYCKLNNLNDIAFSEKVYHFKYNIPHVMICSNAECSNTVNYKNSTYGYYRYCSTACISRDAVIKSMKRDKSLVKYGTNTPAESDVIKLKMLQTINAKSEEDRLIIKNKRSQTNIKNYGVDNPCKVKEIIEKRVKIFKQHNTWRINFEMTMIQRYGSVIPQRVDSIKQATINTNMKRYGVKYTLQSDNVKLSIKLTNADKYGVEHPMQNSAYKEIVVSHINKTYLNKLKIYYKDYILLDKNNDIYTFCCDLNNEHNFTINATLLHSRHADKTTLCTVCNPCNSSKSGLELQLLEFIKNNYCGNVVSNTRKVINGFELDIYLPDIKIAFEFNGTYWHSEQHKPMAYHKIKTDLCEEVGIQLIHVYQDDWLYKKNVVKFKILKLLNKIYSKIHADSCIIKELLPEESILFITDNTLLLNDLQNSTTYGLFYNDILVSTLTYRRHYEAYEIVSYCDILSYIVVGGYTKLFNYFIDIINPTSVYSYVDRSWLDNTLFIQFNFKAVCITSPSYYYVIKGIRVNEHAVDIKQYSNIFKIYDSGSIKYEIIYN